MTVKESIVLIAGPLGGGKTSTVESYQQGGPWVRLNRDIIGGGLSSSDAPIYNELRRQYAQGVRHFVLDNSYGTVAMRAIPIALGKELGLPVTLKWLGTTKEQAQLFASLRQVRRVGRLLTPDDYKVHKVHKNDPNLFPPIAQFAYWKAREEPTLAEGFADIEHVPVVTTLGPEYVNKAVIFDYDGTLRSAPEGMKWPTHPSHVTLMPGRREKLQQLKHLGVLVLGASNQSGVSRKPTDPNYLSDQMARDCFDRTNHLLGVKIDYLFATERGGVPQSYWRKPCPGMGAVFIEKYKLDPAACLMVGDRGEDRTFALRCGFQFELAKDYFND